MSMLALNSRFKECHIIAKRGIGGRRRVYETKVRDVTRRLVCEREQIVGDEEDAKGKREMRKVG